MSVPVDRPNGGLRRERGQGGISKIQASTSNGRVALEN
jgi:hypothetical protein